MESFQVIFSNQVINLIFQAYNSGLLQYHPMSIAGINVTMTMFRNFNQLAFQFNGRLLSISMYDGDNEDTQLPSIENLIIDLLK